MYVFQLKQFIKRRSPEEIRALIAEIKQTQEMQSSRAADELFVRTVGCRSLELYNDEYYKNVVEYDLGLLHAFCGWEREASAYLSNSDTLAAVGDEMLFQDHVAQAGKLAEKQQSKSKRFRPLLITSLPKSGSASVTQSISRLLKLPVLRVSAGRFPNYAVVERWLRQWREGGCLTHDHFPATAHNREMLEKIGVPRIFVQIRDPRAAVWSLVRMSGRTHYVSHEKDNAEKGMLAEHHKFVRWMEGWMDFAASKPACEVRWIKYADFRRDPAAAVKRIVREGRLGLYADLMVAGSARRVARALVQANFERGDDIAWQEHISGSVREQMWAQLSSAVIDLLELAP